MSTSIAPSPERARMASMPGNAFQRAGAYFRPWHRRVLAVILAIAAFVDFYQLQSLGYANSYYAAAVKSMLQSWHNFFFVSFDPGGFVTVDKPPLGFWIQTASAKIFGFSGFSILLPEALAGVASVAVLYVLVRRVFGVVPGLLAALALALMPISVVTNRNNTIDSLLVLTVLLAAYAVSRAVEHGSLRWLLLSALLVGLGFNIKMLEAYLVVPALAAVYLFGSPKPWRVRIGHLLLAGVVMLVISLAWVVAVDLTPASARPYVGSSQTNSELELAIGYNGIERLTGGLFHAPAASSSASGATQTATGFAGGGPGGVSENGQPGILRLFDAQLGGQTSWLLPLGLVGLFASGWMIRPRRAVAAWLDGRVERPAHLNARQSAWVLWGLWTATQAVFFSIAGFFHTYYLSMLGPGVAALAGIGAYVLWQDFRKPGWRRVLLPAGLALTALAQVYVLANFPSYATWLSPVIIAGTLIAIGVLIWSHVRAQPELEESGVVVASTVQGNFVSGWMRRPRLQQAAAIVGLAVLFVGPVLWVGVSLARGASGALPSAGPTARVAGFTGGQFREFTRGAFAGRNPFGDANDSPAFPSFGGSTDTTGEGAFPGFGDFPTDGRSATGAAVGTPGGASNVNQQLLSYLEAHQGSAKYLVAVTSANEAAPYILATGKPVMALGGFLGTDPILTTTQLQQLVQNGTVRYFLLGGGGGFGRGNSSATQWVTSTCATVSASAYGGTAGGMSLYDCAPATGK